MDGSGAGSTQAPEQEPSECARFHHPRSTTERIGQAITDGVETERYYFGTRVESDWSVGGRVVYAYPDGSVAADGSVLEIDPGRRLVISFHARLDPAIEAEGPVRMAWEIEPAPGGVAKLTVVTNGLVEGSATERDDSPVSRPARSRPARAA